MTPKQAALLLGCPVGTVYSWIHRNGIRQLGMLGRWPAYDFREIAAVDARQRRKREAEAAAGEPAAGLQPAA